MTNRPDRYTDLDTAQAAAVARHVNERLGELGWSQKQAVRETKAAGRPVSEPIWRSLQTAEVRTYWTGKLRDVAYVLGWSDEAITDDIRNGRHPALRAPGDPALSERLSALEARLAEVREENVSQREILAEILRRLDDRG